jgi:cell division protein FtsX
MWRQPLALLGHNDSSPILPRRGTTGPSLVIVMTIMSFLACLAVWSFLFLVCAHAKLGLWKRTREIPKTTWRLISPTA